MHGKERLGKELKRSSDYRIHLASLAVMIY